MKASAGPVAEPESNARLIRRLFGLAWRYRARCVQVLVLQLVLLTLGLSGLSLTGLGIDYIAWVIGERGAGKVVDFPHAKFGMQLPQSWEPLQVLLLIASCILAFAILRAVLNFLYTISINRLVQQRLVVDLRGEVYDKLQRLSFRFFDANTTGSIITRVTGDVQAVRMFVDQVMIQSVIMIVSLTLYTIYMVSLHPGLTLACLATTPVLAILSTWFSRYIQPRYAVSREREETMVQHLAESIQGVQVTKAFGREQEDREAFQKKNQAVFDHQRGIFWRVSIYTPAVGFLTRINMIVLLGYGGWLVIQGQLPLGTGLVVFAGLLDQFSGQVNQVATLANSVQQSLVGARRVFEILDAPIEVSDVAGAPQRSHLGGAVRFENVSFSYSTADPILQDINLDVKPGQCVAILGATGAGKSSLMSLVPRFYDASAGRVLVGGTDVRELRLDDLRRNIG
ncbi:MAG: ABC transporter ATP-binding protein, partial [Rariglobus sp.]